MKHIILTEEEANTILGILSELPIRHLAIVQSVQSFLAKKFAELVRSEGEYSAIYDSKS